jgi:uncharacterized protein (TIGR02145 family)
MPFVLTSTTMSTNLNADLLDNQHGAYYAAATSISGTQNLIAKFATATTVGDSRIFDNGTNIGIGNTNPLTYLNIGNAIYMTALGGNVGIGTTNPLYKLDVNGDARIATLAAGATDNVVTQSAGVLQTRTIDSRVWGSSLLDYSGTNTNYVPYFSDANTLTKSNIYFDGTNVGIGTTSVGTYNLNVNGTVNATSYYAGGNLISPLTAGTITGQTLYWNGAAWTANVNLFNNNTSVGIGTTNLSGVKFKIANTGAGSSSVSDSYDDQSKIAGAVDATVSSSKMHVSETTCGTYSVLDADGNTYNTVLVNGRCWLDRNLGATAVATAYNNPTTSYGYLFQWGRSRDGHQKTLYSDGANSATTSTLSPTDTVSAPDTASFIMNPNANYDWKTNETKNDELWRGNPGNGGANNPCPTGFRVPTQPEWSAVATAIGLTTANCGGTSTCRETAASSSLHLPTAGYRSRSDGALNYQGSYGGYWSSGPDGTDAYFLYFDSTSVNPAYVDNRADGFSVRCVND